MTSASGNTTLILKNSYIKAEVDALIPSSANAPQIVAKLQYFKDYGSAVNGAHSGNGAVTLVGKYNVTSVTQSYYNFQSSNSDFSNPLSTYRVQVDFATNLANTSYAVLATESSTNGVIPSILSSGVAVNTKTVSGFQFSVRVKESNNVSNWNLPFGFDLIVVN